MLVIDNGVFRGYVPVNHHWINNDPNTYFKASNSVEPTERTRRFRRSSFSSFDLKDYQVVRGQFLSRRAECPCITITDQRISFNAECLRRFRKAEYIQLLIHPSERKLAIRPCTEHDAHSIRWQNTSAKRSFTKTLNCSYFSSCLFQIMEWNPEYRYQVRGTWIASEKDEIIIFDVTKALAVYTLETHQKKRRVEYIPESWMDTFGDEFYDFSLRNEFYSLRQNTDWKSQEQGHAVYDSAQIQILSKEEVQMNIEKLRRRTGEADEPSGR